MADDLFHDLPPPSAPKSQQISHSSVIGGRESSPKPPPLPPAAPAPALKSALKRPKPQPESQPEGTFNNFRCLIFVLLLLFVKIGLAIDSTLMLFVIEGFWGFHFRLLILMFEVLACG